MKMQSGKRMTSQRKIAWITILMSLITGLCAVFLIVRSVRPSRGRPYEMLSVEDAKTYMSYEENYVIVDVRTPEAYAAGHLDRALNIPYDKIVRQAYSYLGDAGETIYVYGENEEQSCAAAQKLSNMGYTGVAEIGSYEDWKTDLSETESEGLMECKIN